MGASGRKTLQVNQPAECELSFETLDQHIAEVLAETAPVSAAEPARILIVVADPQRCAAVVQMLQRQRHRCTAAGCLDEARTAIARSRFDLIVLECTLPDGDGLELMPLVQKTSPATKTMVISDDNSGSSAVCAMRSGAVDLLTFPLDAEDFARRIDTALIKSRVERQRDERLARLQKICRELNVARHEITKQVDALCGDLANAYQDIAEQMSDVAMASEFRTLLKQELDVEDLLRTTLEYVLTKTGPTNAAVFLPDARGAGSHQNYGLGAYVNFDCPRETISVLLDHLCQAICPQMAEEPEIVSFSDSEEFAEWIGADAGFLADSEVIAFSCRYKADCLAVFVLFRKKSQPFNEKLAAALDTLRTIIAEQLSNVIRVHHRARPSWPKEAEEGDLDCNDDYGFGFEGGLAA